MAHATARAIVSLSFLVLGNHVPAAAQTATAGLQERSSAGPRPLVFDHVTVVDVAQGRLVPEQRVTVVGNRIVAAGSVGSLPLPSEARVVDARGKYLIPGLWDMHLHLWMAPETVGYPLLLANGVTGIRDPGSNVPLDTLRQWKHAIAAGTRAGPRLVVAGPSIFSCPLPPVAADYHTGVCISTPAEAGAVVDSLQAAGADFLESYIMLRNLPKAAALYFALAAAARQAGLPFGGRAPLWAASHASDSGARFLNNNSYRSLDGPCEGWYAETGGKTDACAAVAEHLRHHDAWVVITPPLPRFRYQLDEYHRYFPQTLSAHDPGVDSARVDLDAWFAMLGSIPVNARPASTAAWRTALGYVDPITDTVLFRSPGNGRVMEAAGLPIVVGTDAVFAAPSAFMGLPGFTLHDALAMLVVGGMTPLAALRSATLNPAQALHLADSLGTVEAGKLADLVLLDADPLAEITNTTKIRAVVANGHYYDRAGLDRLLAEAQAKAHQKP